MANTEMRMPVVLMPARRAASALPPTAKTCRPHRVRRVMTSNAMTSVSRISSATGKPRSR